MKWVTSGILVKELVLRSVKLPLSFTTIMATAVGSTSLIILLITLTLKVAQPETWLASTMMLNSRLALTFLPAGLVVALLLKFPFSGTLPKVSPRSGGLLLALTWIPLGLCGFWATRPLLEFWGSAYSNLEAMGFSGELRKAFFSEYGGVVLWPMIPIGLLLFLELGPLISFCTSSIVLPAVQSWQSNLFPRYLIACGILNLAFVAGLFYDLDFSKGIGEIVLPSFSSSGTPEIEEMRSIAQLIREHEKGLEGGAAAFLLLFAIYVLYGTTVIIVRRRGSPETVSEPSLPTDLLAVENLTLLGARSGFDPGDSKLDALFHQSEYHIRCKDRFHFGRFSAKIYGLDGPKPILYTAKSGIFSGEVAVCLVGETESILTLKARSPILSFQSGYTVRTSGNDRTLGLIRSGWGGTWLLLSEDDRELARGIRSGQNHWELKAAGQRLALVLRFWPNLVIRFSPETGNLIDRRLGLAWALLLHFHDRPGTGP